ncbi:hypothetical protein V5799_021822 [Amblyomma americanum]|uniref:Uncharacterized protein n=1 Tax=Amblyomma americanum TaxID=6943 RepID=A0AAQ4FNU4_AMBAM
MHRRTLVARQPQSREQDAPAGTRAPLTSESCPAPIPCPLRWERCPEGPSKGIHMPQAAVGPKKTTAATALSSMPKVFSGPARRQTGCWSAPRRRQQAPCLQCDQCSLVLATTLKGTQSTSGGAVDHFYRPSSSAPRTDSVSFLEAKAGLYRLSFATSEQQRALCLLQRLLRVSK